MTDRDKYRTKCAKIIAIAFMGEGPWSAATEDEKGAYILDGLDAFDALNGVVRVNPIEATEEMIDGAPYGMMRLRDIWRAMSAAGDLTMPPEKT